VIVKTKIGDIKIITGSNLKNKVMKQIEQKHNNNNHEKFLHISSKCHYLRRLCTSKQIENKEKRLYLIVSAMLLLAAPKYISSISCLSSTSKDILRITQVIVLVTMATKQITKNFSLFE
jgi:hypothetical protein